jgi:argininosuccinate synthase
MNESNQVVLAFSGGLDTSFCVPYLIDQGYRVVTLFVDTGGTEEEEKSHIQQRAVELGASEHVTEDAGNELWGEVVVPLVKAGAAYQDQYPLLCSDRYIIVHKALGLCRRLGTRVFAHGCTGMGNDQLRFDQTVRSLGDFDIVAPIREIQHRYPSVRDHEQAYLEERGFQVPPKASRYTVNRNLLGVTISGSEVDELQSPGEETYDLTAPPSRWPREPLRATVTFERGEPVRLDGEALPGPQMLARLNRLFGAYGVGRGIYTGDTTVGLKGRIVFECPGITALLTSHRALEEAILSQHQNAFKPMAARRWVELVYQGFFYEPLKGDLEALINRMQTFVTGEVSLETHGGSCQAVALQSDHILRREGAGYAQSADWGAAEAEGFIKLFGQSSAMSARINPLHPTDPEEEEP